MIEKYSLNEQTLKFIQEFERTVAPDKAYTTQKLVNIFNNSTFNKEQFDTYIEPKGKAIWWALKRSGNWVQIKRGLYKKK
ncbi:hypothetical protein COM90_06605 [Bacillus thuringiensis]|uniref:Uncharacterized protein n=1 Tax=Bacillus thuringiensis TaxID=1428 RepID=A0AB36TXQ6_BACTU|nr:hypothetical protein [Bacillus thuringiensis]PEE65997.1 hypothetical protein COM74_05590 [Bacillus thuringiensis]PEE89535.1 hypothetical protein COM90_06605 [Bacillus thuringiensis]PEV89875.1 hypothetical protein CN442_13090 [Bacillus thuringiensis]PFK86542.1 hypothetical protein COJ04_24950 [Bacillus thuringiensis]PFM91505.1 hypothetical protein COJ61_15385 [Bacillus thuringiensis]